MKRVSVFVKAIRGAAVFQFKRFLASLRKDWHKHAAALILLVVVTMGITTVLSKAYQYRDIGSDASFARLEGQGWDFERGASPVAHDEFGDQASTVRYLWQGWTPADSMRFYTVTQGSDLLPYDFFLALQKPGSDQLVRSDENMNYFRYLTQKPTVSNPDALPVGFVRDSYKGTDYVGLTCAACHTAQVNYNNIAVRIDGGPAMADLDGFLHQLAAAVCQTSVAGAVHDRFVERVRDLGHYSTADKINKDLTKACQTLSLYNAMNSSSTAYGNARLDAFGRIYNRVMQYILTEDELNQQLDSMTESLAENGTISTKKAEDVDRDGRRKIKTDKSREDVIEALSNAVVTNGQSALLKQIFIEPNAPVSYPFLWDTPQHDYVQWNGIAANAGLGPIGRNTGEVIGTFATLDWREKDGFSVSAVLSGQGFKSRHVSFESSIKVHNLRLIEAQLARLQSPQWPDFFPPIDQASSFRGEVLFAKNCEQCHARIQRDDPKRRIVAFFSDIDAVGTDRQMAQNSIAYKGLSGILRNQYVNAGPGDILIDEKAPAAALLTKATLSVVATPEDKSFLVRGYDWAYDLIAALFSNDIKPSLKQGNYTPDTTRSPYASLSAYKGRSLNGIWATAPYLHNGSVPSLYALLLPPRAPGSPANGEYRPDQFRVGSREFEPDVVGLKSQGYKGFTFDTSKPGNSNAGHIYGTNLTPAERKDLIEYLKTL
jgi:hypothetical protein